MLKIDTKKKLLELLKGLSTDDLREACDVTIEAFKSSRTLDSVVMKGTLSVGMKVSWSGRKGYHEGTVKKINRTKAVVVETGVGMPLTWTVPMSMLKPM